ncbi:MAG: amidohydrolase, partial [Bryobacteraceae bacterium]|nr:amidohydrolase [Bryobacteraceae bacterium]
MARSLTLAVLLFSASLCAQRLAITGALVVDGRGSPPRPATVLVENGRIAAVGDNIAVPAGTA